MDSNEMQLINARFNDLRDDIKPELIEIKEILKDIRFEHQSHKIICNNRITPLEHLKTKMITIGAGLSLILGLLIGVRI